MSKVYTMIISRWSRFLGRYVTDFQKSESHNYYGPVALCCGATSAQKNLEANQSDFFQTMTSQAKEVFGDSSAVFKDLVGAFSPIVAAGPNQRGFSDQERAALNTQVTEGTAQAYEHASKAVSERQAAAGGGNIYIPKGQDEQIQAGIATSAAQQEASQRLGITEADYAQGRQNFVTAAQGLEADPGVFSPATSMDNAATGAGESAEKTADDIAQANNSWVNAVTGAIGGVAGAAATAGIKRGCWIAAATFDGWDDPRTSLVRNWLWTEFIRHWYGRPILWFYERFGERVAKRPRLVKILRPLFMAALRKAQGE